jgi:hypothetical protein
MTQIRKQFHALRAAKTRVKKNTSGWQRLASVLSKQQMIIPLKESGHVTHRN